jgi:hypothetical protein
VSRLVEPNGAQVLPPVSDSRSLFSAWVAHLAADADMRTKHVEYRAVAGELTVEVSS